jgi:hypothetical protein
MVKMNFSSFGITKMEHKYASCLIVYDDDPIFHDGQFLDYIEDIMEKIGKATNVTSTAIIFADMNSFVLDWHALDIEFELKNQVIMFEDEKVMHTLYIEDLLSEFEKLKNQD